MAEFIQGLTNTDNGVTLSSIWGQIVPIAGFIASLVLVKIGYNQVKKTTNSATRINSKKVM